MTDLNESDHADHMMLAVEFKYSTREMLSYGRRFRRTFGALPIRDLSTADVIDHIAQMAKLVAAEDKEHGIYTGYHANLIRARKFSERFRKTFG